MKTDARRVLAVAAFPLLLAAVTVPVLIWHEQLWKLFTSGGLLRDWVAARGSWAPLAFMGLQALQVIVFVLPGEVVQIAGGYLFGIWKGTLLSLAGILCGSTVDFFLARILGRPFVASLFASERVAAIEKLLAMRSARIIFFLLFLLPGVPKDILCYVAGIASMRLGFFLIASALGRLPGILGSSLIGHAAATERWALTGAIAAGAILLFAAGILLRPRIQRWIESIGERKK